MTKIEQHKSINVNMYKGLFLRVNSITILLEIQITRGGYEFIRGF